MYLQMDYKQKKLEKLISARNGRAKVKLALLG
jgi:hypothetical protein